MVGETTKADADLIAMWDKACQHDQRGKRNAKKSTSSEHTLQVKCVQYFRHAFPEYDELLFAIPNGGKRNVRVAVKLKAEGVVSGVPDLFLAIPSGEWHGLFIEMKNGKSNDVTDNQQRIMFKLAMQKYKTAVARSYEDFCKIIQEYLYEREKCCNFARD